MQVHNVECQLAQAQMNLYLAGDAMDEAAVAELERHIAECEPCRLALQHKKRSLQSLLQKAVGAEDMSVPARPELRIERPTQAVAQVADEDVPAALKPMGAGVAAQVKNWKPIAYSGALALVLVTISLIGDPSKWLGGRIADKAKPVATKSEEPAEETKKAAPEPEDIHAADNALVAAKDSDDDPLVDTDPAILADSPEHAVAEYSAHIASKEANPESKPDEHVEAARDPAPAAKPAPVVKHPVAKRIIRRPSAKRIVRRKKPVSRPTPVAKAKGGGIRVYDESGRPVRH